jgi:hypothetical protein
LSSVRTKSTELTLTLSSGPPPINILHLQSGTSRCCNLCWTSTMDSKAFFQPPSTQTQCLTLYRFYSNEEKKISVIEEYIFYFS